MNLICFLTNKHRYFNNSRYEKMATELIDTGTKPIHWMAAGAIKVLNNKCIRCGEVSMDIWIS